MPPFTPDQRNIGGRKMIINLLYNHRQQLNTIQKALQKSCKWGTSDCQLCGGSPTVINSPKRRVVQPDLKQVLATFQKVQEISNARRGVIDTSVPIQLKRHINRSERNLEHEANLRIQRKKIQDLTNGINRKKNTLDYLLFPTFLFRRKTVSEQTLTPSPLKRKDNTINSNSMHQGQIQPLGSGKELVHSKNELTQLLFKDPYQVPYSATIKSRKKPKLFPFSTAQLGQLYKIKSLYQKQLIKVDMQEWGNFKQQSEMERMRVEEYDEFKNNLKGVIEANGIYSVNDYEKLIKLIQHLFPEVGKCELIKIFNEIISEFKNESFQ